MYRAELADWLRRVKSWNLSWIFRLLLHISRCERADISRVAEDGHSMEAAVKVGWRQEHWMSKVTRRVQMHELQ
jgi:hypothetical protein